MNDPFSYVMVFLLGWIVACGYILYRMERNDHKR